MPSQKSAAEKPKLFADLPARLSLRVSDLDALMTQPVGATVHTLIAAGFPFKGEVVSRSAANAEYSTVVIKSTNRRGAALSITRSFDPTGKPVFSGRIVSLRNGDAFEMVQQEGEYFLVKRHLGELIAE